MRGSSGNLVFKFEAWTPTRLGSGPIFTRWKSNLLRSVTRKFVHEQSYTSNLLNRVLLASHAERFGESTRYFAFPAIGATMN